MRLSNNKQLAHYVETLWESNPQSFISHTSQRICFNVWRKQRGELRQAHGPICRAISKYDRDYHTNRTSANEYTELADGGAGLICTGNIPIHRDNLENYNNAVLDPNNPWDPVAAFTPAAKAAKSRGAIFLPQLQFPGRQVPEFLNKNPKSSSDQQLEPCLNKTYGKPSPLTKAEIKDLISRYVWASEVLAEAGADGIIVSVWIYSWLVMKS